MYYQRNIDKYSKILNQIRSDLTILGVYILHAKFVSMYEYYYPILFVPILRTEYTILILILIHYLVYEYEIMGVLPVEQNNSIGILLFCSKL